ncbi:hypothetical protein [Nonomuraea wenchangensis]|uniref:hypothetical protein n=1 Tax=Nonomuraea wenchangensis TaxID=568860 RepID=UPI003324D5DE
MSLQWWQLVVVVGICMAAGTVIERVLRLRSVRLGVLWPRRRLSVADFGGPEASSTGTVLVVVLALIAITLGLDSAAASLGAGELGDLMAGIGGVLSGSVALVLAWRQIRKEGRKKETKEPADGGEADDQWTRGELFLIYNVLDALKQGQLDARKVAQLNTVIETLGKGRLGEEGDARD